MKKVFKEIIREFHASTIPVPTKRDIVLPEYLEQVRKAVVFIGVRRCGKTWTFYQIMQDLLSKGLEFSKILYINFADEQLRYMGTADLREILNAYFELYPEYVGRKDVHFFFDEIQEVDGWEEFIRRLLDQKQMHLYLTGSSSKALSTEIATSLRGRSFMQEIFPFSFRETLAHMNIKVPQSFAGKDKFMILHG